MPAITQNPLAQDQLAQDSSVLDFSEDIRPILSDRCFFCHGPDNAKREADLRLDLEEFAHEYAIVPGDIESSPLTQRILSEDPDLQMPPPDSKLTLTAEEKRSLVQWVKSGAKYDHHWAFTKINRPAVPDPKATTAKATALQPIDAFVAAKLRTLGLSSAPEADKETLIRRVTYDLTGLPPSRQEIDEFLSEDDPQAYERLVDRLLASKRYGERMAVDWLDVARYADTHGYQNDRYRPMWPWRDWVVQAFNENLPYDQFISWQLAGDLYPNPSREQRLATAFNRNHRQTNEGGSVEEEFRAEYVADRVNTFGAAFLGLTLECSRCHDHKYDPISQKEYYQLAAFFNSIDESGLYSHFTESTPTPALQLTTKQQAEQLQKCQAELEKLEERERSFMLSEAAYQEWRESLKDVRLPGRFRHRTRSLQEILEKSIAISCIGDYSLEKLEGKQLANRADAELPGKLMDSPEFATGKFGKGLRLSGDNSAAFNAGGDFTRDQPFSISLWIKSPHRYSRAVILHRSRAWTDSASRGYELLIEDGKLSAALVHFWPGNALRVVSEEEVPTNRWQQVTLTYDGSSRAAGLQIFVDGELQATKVVRDKLTRTIDASPKELTIGARFRDNGFKDGLVDELRVFNKELNPLEVRYLYLKDQSPANIGEYLYNLSEEKLRSYCRRQDDEYCEILKQLRDAREKRSRIIEGVEEIMVMQEESQPRPTYVLMRGAYDAPSDRVERGFPQALLALEGNDLDRLDLAKWLTHPDHPLTARVAVNRFWQALFGRGLVQTAEDFGMQGSPPTHPELLDWLAAEFIDSGWNVKALLKRILMSRTYRQSSNPTTEHLRLDPENHWLARGPALRLPAEMIRDTALFASGLLVEKLGGPPVKPYQPAGLWKEKSGVTYTRDKGEGSYRRSLYTYWKRTSPPPAMMTLDASNREVCVVRRQVTMTPLQMLVLWNDPQYVEAARVLAELGLQHSDELEMQLEYVFRSLVSRRPDGREVNVLISLHNEQYSLFVEDEQAAKSLIEVGDHTADQSLEPAALAALTVVVEGLMSYDETVMKR